MRHLSYDDMANLLDSKIEEIRQMGFDEIVGVVRGGLTPAQYVATQLRAKMGVFFPYTEDHPKPRLILSRPDKSKKILFVEDLVSKGRTYSEIKRYMADWHPDKTWHFMPVFMDSSVTLKNDLCPLRTSEWIAMPWEKPEHVKVGGKGLFRFNEDGYQK